jgi:uncharacterized protein (DUF305 family)
MRADYLKLGLNLAISAVLMFLIMFAMIDGLGDFYANLNMAYMALMMVAPMGVLMLLMMPGMYRNRRLNLILHGLLVLLFAAAFRATRTQALVGDRQFLRSMIPHHSGAILMCREAPVSDPEIVALCGRIERSQRAEIDEMKAILARE